MGNNLLILLKQKDIRTFETIFHQFYNPLYCYAQRILQDEEVAKDVIQDIFFELYTSTPKLNNPNDLKPYLYKVVYNKCLNVIKHNNIVAKYNDKVITDFYTTEIILPPEQEEDLYERRLAYIKHGIDTLPDKCRQIMEYKLQGLSNANIAEKMELNIKTVENQISIAYKKLKNSISFISLFIVHILHTQKEKQ